jgi:cellulose synthase/poly-beta-1,6-N-acetylglucosamine synthase-like glycosyltransferase
MDPRMLTEDIDASIRAMLYGFKGVYDHNLVSLEQPPPDFPALIKQRLRWTQGWYQVRLSSLSLSLSLRLSLLSLSLSLIWDDAHAPPRWAVR